MKKSSQSKRLAKKREKERRFQIGDSNYENNAMEEVKSHSSDPHDHIPSLGLLFMLYFGLEITSFNAIIIIQTTLFPLKLKGAMRDLHVARCKFEIEPFFYLFLTFLSDFYLPKCNKHLGNKQEIVLRF